MNSARWFAFPNGHTAGVLGCWVAVAISSADPVTLLQFQDRLRAEHPAFQAEDLAVRAAVHRRDAARGGEDWIFSSSPFYRDEEPIASSAFSPSEQQSFGADATVARKIWRTGGQFALSLNYDFADQVTPLIEFPGTAPGQGFESSEPTFHRHRALISYLHPLLKNAGGEQDRLGYDLKNHVVQLERIQRAEQQEDLLLQLSLKFVDTVLRSEQQSIAQKREDLSQAQLLESEQQRTQNLIDAVDVLRAENNVHIARQRTLLARSRYRAALAELRTLGGYDESFEPEFNLHEARAIPDTDVVLREVKKQSRLLAAVDVDRRRLIRQAAALRDGEQAQLDLAVSGGLGSGNDTYGDSLTFDKPEYQLGFRFSVPWGNRSIAEEAEANRLERERSEKQRANVSRGLEAAVRNTIIQLQELQEILKINRSQIASARNQTEEELKLYEQGRSALTFVIQSRDGEAQAENLLVENAALFHTLFMQLQALTDQLLPE